MHMRNTQKIKLPKTCQKRLYKHIQVVLCNNSNNNNNNNSLILVVRKFYLLMIKCA